MQQIAPNIYFSTVYPGVNVGLVVTDGGAIAIDAPARPSDARLWREQILRIARGPVRYVVLTDDHPDRLLGIAWLEAPVVAGRATLQRLRDAGSALWQMCLDDWSRRCPNIGPVRAGPVLPQIAVSGRITLYGSVPVIVEAVAGAAPGSVWVRLPQQGVLFAGDTVVAQTHPLLAEAPDTRSWLQSLVELRRKESPFWLIVPGRGPVGGKEITQGVSEYIQRARRRIRALHAAGGGRAELTRLVGEFMALFPVKEDDREPVQQKVRAGLERVFEELRPEGAARQG